MAKRNDDYRTLDGSYNNPDHPEWGAACTPLRRVVQPPDYAGSSGMASREDLINPRRVSHAICQGGKGNPHPFLTDFVWAWGQFLDHELDLSPESEDKDNERHIDVPNDVPGPTGETGNWQVPFKRSATKIHPKVNTFEPSVSAAASGQREQINVLSSYIDASNVYGINPIRASFLRDYRGRGRMKLSKRKFALGLLPRSPGGFHNAQVPDSISARNFYIAGDVRANEHAVLLSLHTLWVREHNRLCGFWYPKAKQLLEAEMGKLKASNLWMLEEEVFQAVRKVVGAKMQVITYKEFLPALLGSKSMMTYQGYRQNIDASVCNEFSSAFYRIGHSMLNGEIVSGVKGGTHALHSLFFRPNLVYDNGIEEFLGGLHKQAMQQVDVKIVDSVREFLFHPPLNINSAKKPTSFFDLAALNIQRGRDHGLPGYNDCRTAYGLAPKGSFSEITSDKSLASDLQSLYGAVNNIDPWIGGLAEDHVPGAAVGELVRTALIEQFTRLRDGDRFWWENDAAEVLRDSEMRKEIEECTLGEVLNANTEGVEFPDDVFRLSK